MLVLPTSIASSMSCSDPLRGPRSPGQPGQLAGDDPAVATHAQRPVLIDAGRDAGAWFRSMDPGHLRAGGARRAAPPRVENSIEPSVEKIAIAAPHGSKRLGEHDRPIDRPPELRLERRRAIAKIRRVCRRGNVDSVADDDQVRRVTGGLGK